MLDKDSQNTETYVISVSKIQGVSKKYKRLIDHRTKDLFDYQIIF